ncbi:MAG TPA: hypothetical protein VK932_31620 [Kofleriaceae bacterium]|nr:hypothetical protein [Kofleriaceae bacterium]
MRAFLGISVLLVACSSAPDPSGEACPAMTGPDAGELSALSAQRCNVPGSMGVRNWYRLSAMLPGGDDIVQVELWPDRGAFRGGPIVPGTYQLTGDDLDFGTCGVCLRAIGDKGLPTQREYFAIAGTVEVTAVSGAEGAPFVATVLEASFAEVNKDHVEVSDGCALDLDHVKISGAVTLMGGAGGGSGGGGGAAVAGCPTTVGD